MIRMIGAFTYHTAMGGSRTIPKYEMGTRISKEEYFEVMSGKKKVAAEAAPAKKQGSEVSPEKTTDKPGIKKVQI